MELHFGRSFILEKHNMEHDQSTMAARHKAVDAYYRLESLQKAAKEVGRPVSFVVRWVSRHKRGFGMGDLPQIWHREISSVK